MSAYGSEDYIDNIASQVGDAVIQGKCHHVAMVTKETPNIIYYDPFSIPHNSTKETFKVEISPNNEYYFTIAICK